ncbi:MAG TPA: endonuclease/exonuclease/phosphatase family protein, partial [Candidatus Binatia bacterium]|nr:endonuclease/exonuclease/phosphatase family protein [Candidatus Binatia bacterium]
VKVISWNLWHRGGAVRSHLVDLIEAERPELLLMQEAKPTLAHLTEIVGGHFHFLPLPKRVYGLAAWTLHAIPEPAFVELPSSRLPGRVPPRLAQIVRVKGIDFANVHLSHGQLLNRRQLRTAADRLHGPAAIIGDYNAVGQIRLAGFHDAGPRQRTHMYRTRLDRCFVRELHCHHPTVLDRGPSDHHPIRMELTRADHK